MTIQSDAPPTTPAVTPTTGEQSATPASDATTAALAAYAARAEKAERELAARAQAEKEAAEKYKADLEANGKHAELAAARAKEIEEYKARLAALEPDANYGRAWRESETKRIERAAEAMDENARRVLEGIEGLQAKSAFVAFFEQTQAREASAAASSPPSSPTRKPPPSAAPAPATATVDLVKMINSGEISVAQARLKYPAEYAAQVDRPSAPPKKLGWFGM